MDEKAIKEQEVSARFWNKVKNSLRRASFLQEAIAAYYCAFDKKTPVKVKAILIGALAYFILPMDMLPDFLAVIGFTDDATVLFTAIRAVRSHITDAHRMAAQEKLGELLAGRN